MDIALLIDYSGSIQRENFAMLIDFLKLMVDELDIDSGKVTM